MRTSRMMWAAAVAAALAGSGAAAAEGTGANQDASSPSTGAGSAMSSEGGNAKIDDNLRDALQKIHATNQAEIQVATSAETKAQSSQVKEFARQMAQDHRQGDQKLQQVAQKVGVSLEGKAYQDALQDHRDKAKDLEKQKGAAYDDAFMTMMVDAHKDAVDDVHDAATKSAEQGNTTLAQALGQIEGKLIHHSAMAHHVQRGLQQQARSQPRENTTGTGAANDDANQMQQEPKQDPTYDANDKAK